MDYLSFFNLNTNKDIKVGGISLLQPYIEAIIKANEQKKSNNNQKNTTNNNQNNSDANKRKSNRTVIIDYNGQYIQPDSISPSGNTYYSSIYI